MNPKEFEQEYSRPFGETIKQAYDRISQEQSRWYTNSLYTPINSVTINLTWTPKGKNAFLDKWEIPDDNS